MDPRPYIVVVEDEAVQRQMLADYLAGQNFRVSALGDGAGLQPDDAVHGVGGRGHHDDADAAALLA